MVTNILLKYLLLSAMTSKPFLGDYCQEYTSTMSEFLHFERIIPVKHNFHQHVVHSCDKMIAHFQHMKCLTILAPKINLKQMVSS